MNVVVCVKPMPGRELNPFDSYALEGAARLRDQDESIRIIAVCLSAEGGEATLRQALAIAADRAVLISDPAAAQCDGLGRSYLLSRIVAALESEEGPCQLIFCGQQSPDEDWGQTGPMLAGWLGWFQATAAVEAHLTEEGLLVQQELEGGEETLMVPLPCVAAFTKPIWTPRLPTVRRSGEASRAQIPVLTLDDLPELDRACYGIQGAALTKLDRKAAPYKTDTVIIKEKTDADSAHVLFGLLNRTGII